MTTVMIISIPSIAVPDCFVHPTMKLNNGTDGHGERRLYTGDSHSINHHITQKPWLLQYDPAYIETFAPYLNQSLHFSKEVADRCAMVEAAVRECEGKEFRVVEQNGKQDVCRYYVGPDKTTKENVQLFDLFRKTLVAKQVSLSLEETEGHFVCRVLSNEAAMVLVGRLPKSAKSSNASEECIQYRARTLGIEIQTEKNGGEFQLRNPKNGYFWPVDGYHNCAIHRCSGTAEAPCPHHNHLWEFQGDYWHGNPQKYSATTGFHNTTYSAKHAKDIAKHEFYGGAGYTVNVIWESEWTAEKKAIKARGETWLANN
jgi:hypothetical protein